MGHASLMRPVRPLPTLRFVSFAATLWLERCRSDYRGQSSPGAWHLHFPGRLAPQGQPTGGWFHTRDLRPIDYNRGDQAPQCQWTFGRNDTDTSLSGAAHWRDRKAACAVACDALDEIDFPAQIFVHCSARVAATFIRLEPYVDRLIRHSLLLRQWLSG